MRVYNHLPISSAAAAAADADADAAVVPCESNAACRRISN